MLSFVEKEVEWADEELLLNYINTGWVTKETFDKTEICQQAQYVFGRI